MNTMSRSAARPWIALLFISAGISAAEDPRLLMFGNEPSLGMWRLEILDASNPETLKAMKEAGSVSVCLDAAKDMGKNVAANPATRCTTRILTNTRTSASMESTCAGGRVTRVTMERESAKTLLFDVNEKGGAAPASSMKGRYHLEGACTAAARSNVLTLDKDSPACTEARSQAAAMTPEAMCGSLPADQQAACVKQLETSLASALKMCQ